MNIGPWKPSTLAANYRENTGALVTLEIMDFKNIGPCENGTKKYRTMGT